MGVRRAPMPTEGEREGMPAAPRGSSDVRVEQTSRDCPAAQVVSATQPPKWGAPADASLPPPQLSITRRTRHTHCRLYR